MKRSVRALPFGASTTVGLDVIPRIGVRFETRCSFLSYRKHGGSVTPPRARSRRLELVTDFLAEQLQGLEAAAVVAAWRPTPSSEQ